VDVVKFLDASYIVSLAATFGHLDILKYFMEHRYDSCRYVRVAAMLQNPPYDNLNKDKALIIVKYLHNMQFHVAFQDVQTDETEVDTHYAAKCGYLRLLRFLLEERGLQTQGASLKDMVTAAIVVACIDGHLEMVEYLNENWWGFFDGMFAIMFADMNGNVEIVEYLKKNGLRAEQV
jgi:hypothetical protein